MMTEQAKVPSIRFAGFTDPWEQRKLGDVASSFDYGLNAAATEYDGQNKYLRITDIDDETHEFSKSDLTTPLADLAMSADYLLKESDLLFARTGASVGKTYLYRQFDGMVYFAGFLIRARIGEGADPEFAYQATLTDAYKKYVAITSQRSGQPGVNAQEYADYQLMLPSKTEQQQIGMTLRSLDDLITLHQRKYDKLVVFKKSMLEKMFPKDGESVPEIRFAGFTDPWEQRKLGEVAPLQRGFDLPVNQMTPGPYPVVMSNGIGGWHSKYMVKGPGVVTGRSGTIGSLHYIEQNFWPHNTSLWVTSFNGNEPRFIYWLYASIGLERFGSGSGVPTLNRNDVHDLRVGFPCDVAEQRRIGTFFSRLDSLITLHQRK
ncbi:restriction endonuclease subunit S, partial [Bifidobacterium bifidum]